VYAVIETGGRQFRVEPGQVIDVEKLPQAEGETVEFDRLLLVKDGEQTLVGTPYVEGARATGTVLKQYRGKKILVFKYKPKANYRRRQGHRQWLTRVRVDRIDYPA
jgi:large subunit ribosomal protein L21